MTSTDYLALFAIEGAYARSHGIDFFVMVPDQEPVPIDSAILDQLRESGFVHRRPTGECVITAAGLAQARNGTQ